MTFLASRVLLRLALKSFYALDEVPSRSFGSHGKPYFDPDLSLFFNFSHSGNYIGAAFGSTEMGFDIECVKDRKNFQGLCKKVLTDPEKNYIFKLSEKDQREFFTLLWTVRESLLKDSVLVWWDYLNYASILSKIAELLLIIPLFAFILITLPHFFQAPLKKLFFR